MARNRTKCRTAGCDHDVKHKVAGLCGRCYSFANYWRNKTVTEKMKRLDQLHFWSKRADQVLAPTGVTSIDTAKKKRQA